MRTNIRKTCKLISIVVVEMVPVGRDILGLVIHIMFKMHTTNVQSSKNEDIALGNDSMNITVNVERMLYDLIVLKL